MKISKNVNTIIGMKRLLHSRFEILETDEFRTSKLYNKNFKEFHLISF